MSNRKYLKKQKYSMLLFLFFIGLVFTNSIIANAYVKNSYPLTSPSSTGVYCSSTKYSSQIISYAKKWNIPNSGLYLYNTNNINGAIIKVSISTAENGLYGVCNNYSKDNKSIVFYKIWQNASELVKNETIVHEFGHAVGLSHTQPSNNSISVMRELGFNGKPYPLSDDKKGIAAIY